MTYFVASMTGFRHHIASRAFTLIVGILFFNLSFLMIEVQAIDLPSHNSTLYESFVRLLSTGFEEEKDSSGESSVEVETETNFIIESFVSDQYHKSLNARSLNELISTSFWHLVHLEIVSPPPKA